MFMLKSKHKAEICGLLQQLSFQNRKIRELTLENNLLRKKVTDLSPPKPPINIPHKDVAKIKRTIDLTDPPGPVYTGYPPPLVVVPKPLVDREKDFDAISVGFLTGPVAPAIPPNTCPCSGGDCK
jgi:hypothetical protein